MTYFSKYDYTIIRRHWIVLLFKYLKLIIFLFITLIFYYIWVNFMDTVSHELIHYLVFPLVLILLNYAFIDLILWYINYYNDLLIINKWELIFIKSSLFFKDNIEFVDIDKISKMDVYCKWLIPNILSFWSLIAEQQRDVVRTFHFVPDPFKAIQLINEEKQKIDEDNKKRYLVDERK